MSTFSNPVISKAMLLLNLNEVTIENLGVVVMPKNGEAYNVAVDAEKVKGLSPEVLRAITVLTGMFHEKYPPTIGYFKTLTSRYGVMTIGRGTEDGYLFAFKPKKTFVLHMTSDPKCACL